MELATRSWSTARAGGRSAEAAKTLSRLGFTNVHKAYNVVGGTDEWQAEGYPLVK